MPRVKRGTVRAAKRKKLLKRAKGYFLTKSKLYQAAQEAVAKADNYAFSGRRRKKRDFRSLWVVRVNAAARKNGLTYGQLINGMKHAGIELDRKSLAELAVKHPAAFTKVAEQVKSVIAKLEPAKTAKAKAKNEGSIAKAKAERNK
ncbi:MAG: 50S ribosomal protein L20 [Acidobacteria bacterium]|jgi:large subunit ribosomal protein L20|nr:50S ribosomal protein L20 [Acidobacteriota bacterium]MBP8273956.1 50S ribosomal protein L20 [Acidobacteriota bacterium]